MLSKNWLWKIVFVLSLGLVLGGCGSQKRYEEAVDQGKVAISERKFDTALTKFEEAKKEKENDKLADTYIKQINDYLTGQKYQKEKKYPESLKAYDDILKTKEGSAQLVEYAKSSKKEVEGIQKEIEQQEFIKKQKEKEEKAKLEKEKKEKEEKEKKEQEIKQQEEEEAKKAKRANKGSELESWTEEKMSQLKEFMASKQYSLYTNHDPLDIDGYSLPNDFLSGQVGARANREVLQFTPQTHGQTIGSTELVALFSNSNDDIYLFTFHKGEPVVYQTSPDSFTDTDIFLVRVEDNNIVHYFNDIARINNHKGQDTPVVTNVEEAGDIISKYRDLFFEPGESYELMFENFNGEYYEARTLGSPIVTIFRVYPNGDLYYREPTFETDDFIKAN